jgi:hypothetical protein
MENNFWLRSMIKFAVICVYLHKNIYKWVNTGTNDVNNVVKMTNCNYVLPSAEYTFISTIFVE